MPSEFEQQQQQNTEESTEQQQNTEVSLEESAKQFEQNFQQQTPESQTNLNPNGGSESQSTVDSEQSTEQSTESTESTESSENKVQNSNYRKQSPTWIENKEKQIEQEKQKSNPDSEYINELKSQLNELKSEIQENIIEKHGVPDELREFLPSDTKKLKTFLNSDKYKKLKEGVQMVEQRNQPKEDAPQPDGPPSNQQQKSKPNPKTFEELSSDDFSAFDDLFL
jgi:hypothetical protein